MEDSFKDINEKWTLPAVYLEFLTRHPKKGKYIEGENFVNGLKLYGASELIKNQVGYSYNPAKKEIIQIWPKDYVVIADDGADPYVIDLSKSDGKDAPILFAYHGEGEWDFKPYAPSFTEFLRGLNVDNSL